MQFADKNEWRAFSTEATAALAAVAQKYGVTAKFIGGSYDRSGATATMKVEVVNKTATGEVQDKRAVDFKALAPLYGLKAEDFGREFKHGGRIFKISGLNRRAKTMPILATCGGQGYKFSSSVVAACLKA